MQKYSADLLEWAKRKLPEDILSHSYVTHSMIREAVEDAYDSPGLIELLGQDNQWGLQNLRFAIGSRYSVFDGPGEQRILLTPGATSAIYLVCETFLKPGDEVVIESPYYEPMVRAATRPGVTVRFWPRKSEDFSLDPDSLDAQLVNEKTKLIFLTNLHNPSSRLTPDSNLKQLGDAVSKLQPSGQVKIVVDEIYRGFFADESSESGVTTAANLGDMFITINSLSKVYGLSRLKCGWICGALDVIGELRELYKVVVGIGSLDLEALSTIFFDRIDEYTEVSRYAVNRNRVILRDELESITADGMLCGEIPQHGSIYFPKLPWLDKLGDEQALETLESISDATGVVPGRFFGKDYSSHMRIGFGQPEDIFLPAVSRLAAVVESYYELSA